MPNRDALAIVRQAFDAWNAHDVKGLQVLLADDYVWDSDTLPAPARGLDAQRQVMEMYLQAFPDLHFEIEQMLPCGDYVVTRWHSTGTHKGELMGIPATNRRGAGIHGCTVHEIKDGRMKHDWVHWDALTLLRQLGVMPPASGR